MRVEHPDTFTCDVCGREIERAHSVTLPVRWTTEQNEGRPCASYVKEETIDLCPACFEMAVVIEAAGCMGRNTYQFVRYERGVVQVPLCYLAKSLENMSLCHAAYFAKGWEDARGCRIEHDAAVAYGLEVLYEG